MELTGINVAATPSNAGAEKNSGLPGTGQLSKFQKVKADVDENAGSDTTSSNAPNPTALPSPGSIDGSADALLKSLSTSKYHLERLKKISISKAETSPMQSVMSRLSDAENQFQQIDSALRAMPPDASAAQWMVLQQMVYNVNENISVLTKVIDQASSGVKSVLQTQV
jgi:hypothetical protein